MSVMVARTCSEIDPNGEGRLRLEESKPLSEFRLTPAYVLLGDPGAGKTTEFLRECEALGSKAKYLKARDFITLDVDSRPEWRDRVLFIDGLDEMRVGVADSRVPLDQIRYRLDRLRPPGFRLSCRAADWLGHNDRQSLEVVSPDSKVTVVQLDPLDQMSVKKLLGSLISQDVEDFIDKAKSQGIRPLLGTPLTLELLVDAVKQGTAWPKSRRDTFEMACKQLASEQNSEHRVHAASESLETVMDAAGYLCALHLLAGIDDYSLPPGPCSPSFVSLGDLEAVPDQVSRDCLKRALATSLFTAKGETAFRPRHRQVAEFLGGRYLARLVREGLPARRVTALMTGPGDGRVVTELRGLSAWLAAHPGEARCLLIDLDPVGVGLYGDIDRFTDADKKRLLSSLATFAREGPLFGHGRRDGRNGGYRDDTAWTFRSLVTGNMVPVIETLIVSEGNDRVVEFALTVLSKADRDLEALADLAPSLEAILRDPARSPRVRQAALDAYLRITPSGDAGTTVLKGLLEALHNRTLSDPDDQLRRTLLGHLYPSELPPTEVWKYVTLRNNQMFIGCFWRFWKDTLLKKSSKQDVADLLDTLQQGPSELSHILEPAYFTDLPVRLLVRGLETMGDDIEPSRLYSWLGGLQRPLYSRYQHEQGRRIRLWLEARPHIQKELFLMWMRMTDSQDTTPLSHRFFKNILYDSSLPSDFGLWCLDRAVVFSQTDVSLSARLLREAFRSLRDLSISDGLSLELIHERLTEKEASLEYLGTLREQSQRGTSDDEAHRREIEEIRERKRRQKTTRSREWVELLHSYELELHANRLPPQYLSALAVVYSGGAADITGETPYDRLMDFLGDDRGLVDLGMAALQGAISREDLPGSGQVISSYRQSQRPFVAYPVLVSLDLLKEDIRFIQGLAPARRPSALAIHYLFPLYRLDAQPWHDLWFEQDPEMVLDTLYQCAVSAIRAGRDFLPGISDLGRIKGHDDLVYYTRLKLIEAFPPRVPKKQELVFDSLLRKVLEHPTATELDDLTQKRLAFKSLSVPQRVRWLMVATLLSEETHMPQLVEYLGLNEKRVRHVAKFLSNTSSGLWSSPILSGYEFSVTLTSLIRMLGTSYGPIELELVGSVTVESNMSEAIYSLIARLGGMTDSEARRGLSELIDDPRLERWRERLIRARERQFVLYRDSLYRPPGITDVQRALNNGTPANAADMAALLSHVLEDIGEYLRGGNTNLWRQFWNEDHRGRPDTRKHEESCRDVLLEALNSRLPPEVDAAPEGRYAAAKRADIRVSFGGFNVPIEIKKNCHRDLWSALRRQLIDQYTSDPATSGCGIFLVLWFGAKKITPPPDGERPTTPEELRRQLKKELTPDEARKISVIVMDVTKPSG